jgi:hypothetical protein
MKTKKVEKAHLGTVLVWVDSLAMYSTETQSS